MTAQAASDAMAKDAGDTASPYGTRSRNRNGSSRPNYAEDRDIDADLYDFYHEKKEGADSKKSSRQASAAASVAAAANGDTPKAANSRKAGTDESRGGQSQNGTKDGHAAGASAAPTSTQHSGTSGSSRKRKAGGHSGGSSGQAAASNGSSKKKAAAEAAAASAAASASASTTATAAATPTASGTPAGISWPDTNMLTFEKCRSRPVDGAMLADDGTVLRPNGNARPVHRELRIEPLSGLTTEMQIMCTLCVSRRASPTTWAASWNSCARRAANRPPST